MEDPRSGLYQKLPDVQRCAESVLRRFVHNAERQNSKNIYDQVLAVSFFEQLRGERKFASAELLVKQMHRDREAAKKVWQKYRSVSR